MGCKIILSFNGILKGSDNDVQETTAFKDITMLSSLTSQQVNAESIAELLLSDKHKQSKADFLELYSKQSQTTGINITPEVIAKQGIVPNTTLESLRSIYPEFSDLNDQMVDLSTPILATTNLVYFSKQIVNSIINVRQNGEQKEIFVINPNKASQRKKLQNYLILKHTLATKQNVDELFTITMDQLKSQIKEGMKKLPEFQQEALKRALSFNTLNDLLLDHASNGWAYKNLYVDFNGHHINLDSYMQSALTQVIRNIPLNLLTDTVAQQVDSLVPTSYKGKYGKWLKVADLNTFTKLRTEVLNSKVSQLQELLQQANEAGNAQDVLSLEDEIAKIQGDIDFINNKGNSDVSRLQKVLDLSDNDVLFKVKKIDNQFYVERTGKTLEDRYPDFSYKTITMYAPEHTYKGYTIYSDPEGRFYASQQVLTNKSYGKRFKTVEQAKYHIDTQMNYTPIVQDSMEGFHRTSDYTATYPKSFKPGQILKVLDVDIEFSTLSPEINLILHSATTIENGINVTNNLQRAKDSYLRVFEGSEDIHRKLEGILPLLDTSEKFMAFVYNFNSAKEGNIEEIANKIVNAKYRYLAVDSVSRRIRKGSYFNIIGDPKTETTYQVTVSPVVNEVTDGKVAMDEKTNRPIPTITMLNDMTTELNNRLKKNFGISEDVIEIADPMQLQEIAQKMSAEFNAEVNVSEMPSFVYNNKVYINPALASGSDLFAQYSGIYLQALRATNPQFYGELLEAALPRPSINSIAEMNEDDIINLQQLVLQKGMTEHLLKYRNPTIDKLTKAQKAQLDQFVEAFEKGTMKGTNISKTNVSIITSTVLDTLGEMQDNTGFGLKFELEISPEIRKAVQDFKAKALEEGAHIDQVC